MRSLAFVVGLLSFGQCASAVLFAGPHSDVPGQPWTSIGIVLAAVAGFALARALWTRRPRAGRGVPAWGAGVALWVVGLTWTLASADEWRAARPALALGLVLWAAVMLGATHYVRRRLREVIA